LRGKLVLLIVALAAVIGTGTFTFSSAQAHNSHVEYVVPQQPGIEVVQHGNAGLVDVTVTDCLVVGEPFTFEMIVSGDRKGDSDLSVRKNSGVDISSWFSLGPQVVNLPGETTVTVSITAPEGTVLDKTAVARIQEIGDPPAPGGHHGVKVRVSCVKQPAPTPTPSPTPPPTGLVPPAQKSPTPEVPKFFPETGGEPPKQESNDSTPAWLVGFGLAFSVVGGYSLYALRYPWRRS